MRPITSRGSRRVLCSSSLTRSGQTILDPGLNTFKDNRVGCGVRVRVHAWHCACVPVRHAWSNAFNQAMTLGWSQSRQRHGGEFGHLCRRREAPPSVVEVTELRGCKPVLFLQPLNSVTFTTLTPVGGTRRRLLQVWPLPTLDGAKGSQPPGPHCG
jgi:hypothetical protein